jgi:amidophosphoribosyltransferase
MAAELQCDSLRYLPISSVARAIGMSANRLCQACITAKYPTIAGQRLYQLDQSQNGCDDRGDCIDDRAVESDDAKNLIR